MVVESLIKPKWVVDDPLYALYLGITLAFIGTSIGLFIFPGDASLAGLLFITIAGVPFLTKVIDYVEEEKGIWSEKFWQRNKTIAWTFGMFFLGVTITYMIWYLILPDVARQFLFDRQITVLTHPGSFMGYATQAQFAFSTIISTNLKVALVCLILSLVYGCGAVMIIAWNASVLGVFLASFGKVTTAAAYIPHATLEFIAFFFAAMSGGLLAMAFSEKAGWGTEKFDRAFTDALILFGLAIGILFLAASIEVGVFLT